MIIDIESILVANIEKLKTRYPDGFSCEQSLKDYKERKGVSI